MEQKNPVPPEELYDWKITSLIPDRKICYPASFLSFYEIIDFLDTQKNELFDPDKHIDSNGTNRLQELKEDKETDVIITLDDQYYLNKEWETYGYVSAEEMEEYYELEYLNRIYSAKSPDGEENAYYWVI